MKINISNNIRELRKERSMMQEQLAEALGVSIAAVSKWERGVATPELNYIIEMADLFETSVDAILGYKLRNNDKEHIIARLKEYIHDKANYDVFAEAEKALKKYPNSFEIVYHCAQIYRVRGIDLQDKKISLRALELLKYACRLIDQNIDNTISTISIQIQMAEIYIALDECEKGIALLQKNNPCRINSALIGETLAAGGNKPDEALPYLSEALLDNIVSQIHIVMGYVNVFIKKKDYHSAVEILQWELTTFPGLKYSDKASFLLKTEAFLYALCGEMYLYLGEHTKACDYLMRAKKIAIQFDEHPNYNTANIRFIVSNTMSTGHDNLGSTAMAAIQNLVDEENSELFTRLWEEIKNDNE